MKNFVIIILIFTNIFMLILINANDDFESKIFSEEKAESFKDLNNNKKYDKGEPFEDLNQNNKWDSSITEFIHRKNNIETIKLNGVVREQKIYFDNNRLKEVRKFDSSEEKHGVWTEYFESNSPYNKNNIKTETVYKKGKLIERIEYFSTGELKQMYTTDINYSNITDVINYYPDGQIQSEGKKILTKSGKEAWYGNWVFYNRDGTIKQEKVFDQNL